MLLSDSIYLISIKLFMSTLCMIAGDMGVQRGISQPTTRARNRDKGTIDRP